jgi:hypothetical protein
MKTRLNLTLAALLTAALLAGCSSGSDTSPSTSESPAASPETPETAAPAPAEKPMLRMPADESRGTLKFIPNRKPSFSLLGAITVAEARALVKRSDAYMRDVFARPDRYSKDAQHYLSSEDVKAIKAIAMPALVKDLFAEVRTTDRILWAAFQKRGNGGEVEPLTVKQSTAVVNAFCLLSSSPRKRRATYTVDTVKATTYDTKGWRGELVVTYRVSINPITSLGGEKGMRYDMGWKQLANGEWRVDDIYWTMDPKKF